MIFSIRLNDWFWSINCLMDWLSERWMGWLYQLTEWINCLIGCMLNWLIESIAGWSIEWFIDLIDGLRYCSNALSVFVLTGLINVYNVSVAVVKYNWTVDVFVRFTTDAGTVLHKFILHPTFNHLMWMPTTLWCPSPSRVFLKKSFKGIHSVSVPSLLREPSPSCPTPAPMFIFSWCLGPMPKCLELKAQ